MERNHQQRHEDLTNLNWLTDLKKFQIFTTPNNHNMTNHKFHINLPAIRFNKFLKAVQVNRDIFMKKRDIYMNNMTDKPPFNYAHLIAMAMMENGRMTLQEICKWIKTNFGYYRKQLNWNNSIRHNLSLSIYFVKVARQKNDKGKGGYWELTMSSKKRRKKRVRTKNNNKTTENNIEINNNNSNNNNHNDETTNNIHLELINVSCDDFLESFLRNNEPLTGPNVIVQHLPYSSEEMILGAGGTQST